MNTDDAKRDMAARAREVRHMAHDRGAVAASIAVSGHFIKGPAGSLGPGAAVAGYWARGDELVVAQLLEALAALGHVCALPAVAEGSDLLAFRRWRPGDRLTEGRYGIMEPAADAEAVIPDMVIAPLLAFDGTGGRLGYGGGYYDRTLRALRKLRPIVAVGVGFAAQGVAAVPFDAETDERLDWLVTETGAAPALT